jgi:hypothetical protein
MGKEKTTGEFKTQSPKFAFWLRPENLERVAGYLQKGYSENQLRRQVFKICTTTFLEWKEKSEDLRKVIEENIYSVEEAEGALIRLMNGYYVTETITDFMGRETKKTRYIQPSPLTFIAPYVDKFCLNSPKFCPS